MGYEINQQLCTYEDNIEQLRMKKRNIVYYLLLILIMAVLTGCGYTQEEKAEMKRYEKQGRENAENYIKAKYGIDAKVRELNC